MLRPSKTKPRAAKRFEARLERLRSRLNWIVVYLPFDAAKLWGLRGQIKVRGQINGFPFRTSLFPTREGRHFMLVNKRMQKGARAFEGNVASLQMEFDSEERIATIPEALQRLLGQDRSLRRRYDALNYSTRNDIAKWIADPKTAEARVRRAEQIAERLLSVMEAERELPPILRVAFARQSPGARRMGWHDGCAPARTPVWHLLLQESRRSSSPHRQNAGGRDFVRARRCETRISNHCPR